MVNLSKLILEILSPLGLFLLLMQVQGQEQPEVKLVGNLMVACAGPIQLFEDFFLSLKDEWLNNLLGPFFFLESRLPRCFVH